ncbi:MAG: WXG100 family type VII secretion target, partial [Chloroflexi bacterium]|nr:WXG100 family type VII secretion target [Chloroflexota bacterium]
MSADVIQAKYDDLDAIASRFSQQSTAVNALSTQVRRGFEALAGGGWEGKGSAAFFAEMENDVFPAVQRLRQVLDEARTVTLEAKAILERAEQEAGALFQDEEEGVTAKPISSYGFSKGSGNVNAAPSQGTSVMDVVHGALDVAGFVPGLGAVPDLINAGIYAIEGDLGNAAMSGVAAVPIIGDAIKGVDK